MSQWDKETLYVAVISQHNVAEAQLIHQHRPAEVVLIASDYMLRPRRLRDGRSAMAPAERLQTWMKQEDIPVTTLAHGETPLSGNRYAETRRWADAVLLPVLDRARAAGRRCVLDTTGGTKVMSAALRDAADWDELLYTPRGGDTERFTAETWGEAAPLTAVPLSPLQQVRLYMPHMAPETPIAAIDQTVLENMFTSYCDKTGPFWELTALLERLIVRSARTPEERRARIEACGGRPRDNTAKAGWVPVSPSLQAWWDEMSAALGGRLERDGASILLPAVEPGRLPRGLRGLGEASRWLQGIWMEDLVTAWAEALIGAGSVTGGLKIQIQGSDKAEQELDLVCQVRGMLRVGEVKVGVQPHYQKLRDANSQLTNKLLSISHELGINQAAFITTPDFLSHLGAQRDHWVERNEAYGISWITSREELARWLR